MIVDEDYEFIKGENPIFHVKQMLVLFRYVLRDVPAHRLNDTLSNLLEVLINVDTDEKFAVFNQLVSCHPSKAELRVAFEKLMDTL